jgi:hypothetical protein
MKKEKGPFHNPHPANGINQQVETQWEKAMV